MDFRDPFAKAAAGTYQQARAVERDAGLRAYMLKIYNYMASALALTGIVALFTANSPALLSALYQVNGNMVGPSGLGYLVMFAPLGLVLWLGMGIHRMSVGTAQAIFWVYSVLIGLSMATIFLTFTGESIARAFFVTAGTFGAMSLYGYTTKRDLTGVGSFMVMGLIGLLVASLVNIFLQSSALSFATSVIGVVIFVGLTAWDTQRLKANYYEVVGHGEAIAKASIMGALNLYMDFINMFMYLLRFFGDRRN
ncbi:MAG: Bax inhibitor-1/YccA family protein [Proteobacteria bacterium]|nr:Bax inhibitor-1/YccA family protein [Pseudomonadota bacterium]